MHCKFSLEELAGVQSEANPLVRGGGPEDGGPEGRCLHSGRSSQKKSSEARGISLCGEEDAQLGLYGVRVAQISGRGRKLTPRGACCKAPRLARHPSLPVISHMKTTRIGQSFWQFGRRMSSHVSGIIPVSQIGNVSVKTFQLTMDGRRPVVGCDLRAIAGTLGLLYSMAEAGIGAALARPHDLRHFGGVVSAREIRALTAGSTRIYPWVFSGGSALSVELSLRRSCSSSFINAPKGNRRASVQTIPSQYSALFDDE